INNFPSNLTITIKDGQASTNVSEPYSMPFPDKLRPPADSKQKAPANLLVIDTQSDSSPSKFSSYDTFILLTKDHVAYGTPDRMTVEQLKTFPDTKIDKQGLQDFANQLSEFAKWLAPIVVIASFLLYCFLFAWNFLYALFGALVVLIIGRFRKTNYRYGEAYRIALHAMTLGVLVNIILLPFAFSGGTGVLSVVAFIAVLWFNLARTAQAPTAAPPTPVA
ncbi:MAG TPA: DUF1189 family protein, partial [Candidatus Paceibacterota bacterium]|nr:DUF1189 family protein [Candidatus Paceibacterota bacterium]